MLLYTQLKIKYESADHKMLQFCIHKLTVLTLLLYTHIKELSKNTPVIFF